MVEQMLENSDTQVWAPDRVELLEGQLWSLMLFQVGEGAWEEVLWQACGVCRPEEDPAQAHQEGQQAQAEASQVNE